jgi:hypothetical protein
MTLALDRPDAAVAPTTPQRRLRRFRRTAGLRALVRETHLDPSMLVAGLFVQPGTGRRDPIGSMPGVARLSPDVAVEEARRLDALGVGGLILFGLPDAKDGVGSGAWARDGIIQETLFRLREADVALPLIADTCLCEYTDHGHCGPLAQDGSVANDLAVALLAETAVSQAAAGADIVAPSAMRPRSSPTPRRQPRPSTGRSATPPIRRPPSATGAATRWTPPTPASRCSRSPSTSPRGRTPSSSSPPSRRSTSSLAPTTASICRSVPTR